MGRTPYKFTAKRREAYLERLRNGSGRMKAAFDVGLTSKTIKRAVDDDPEFMEACAVAEGHATDQVEESLFESARSGNVPAAVKWLEVKRPEVWKEQERPQPGSSPATPLHIALPPGEIDWDIVPDDLADRFLALHEELLALQPASSGMVIEQDGTPVED